MSTIDRSTGAWQHADTSHHPHPFTDYKSLAEEGGSRILERADDTYL